MPDRKIDTLPTEVPELDPTLSKILQYVVGEGRERLERDGELVPFTAVAIGDTLAIEELEGGSPEQYYAMAKHTVEGVRGADAYAFCYDGYLDTDDGQRDAIIAEGGVPGELEGAAVGLIYDEPEEGERTFYDPIAYIGTAPNYMVFLTDEEPVEGEEEEPAE